VLIEEEDVGVDMTFGKSVDGEGKAGIVLDNVSAEEEVCSGYLAISRPWRCFEGRVVEE